MAGHCVVLITVGFADEGRRIAHVLAEERLAACVNLVSPVESVYHKQETWSCWSA